MEYARQTAKKCTISHLLSGKYVQKEGWDPNFVETALGEISRVNLIAVVVGKENNTLTIDDGSGKIDVRNFQGELNFEIGDRVLIVGRLRVYNNLLYVAVEIARKISDDKWLEHRKIEIDVAIKSPVKIVKETLVKPAKKVAETKEVKQAKKEITTSDNILDRIRKLDDGTGVDVDLVTKNMENGDSILKTLLEEGEVFEVKPGKVKVLD